MDNLFFSIVVIIATLTSLTRAADTVTCPQPLVPKNAFLLTKARATYVSGNIVTLACNNGYVTAGEPSRICLPDGKWSHGGITCELPRRARVNQPIPETQENNKNSPIFTCANGDYADISVVCNGIFECSDKSDEKDCKLTCTSGESISLSKQCDGTKDCTDGSDENPRTCLFRCDSGQAIGRNTVCDGFADCSDASDEIGCKTTRVRAEAVTPATKAACKNGQVIRSSDLCNRRIDCADASDEIGCTTINPALTTRPTKATTTHPTFLCTDYKPISMEWVCDGWKDCADGGDEVNCKNMFTCKNGEIIRQAYVCDGERDCGDASDELRCTTKKKPATTPKPATPKPVFECKNGLKLDMMYRCNGLKDCLPNGEDEMNCA